MPVRLAKALAAAGCRVLKFPNAWKGLKNGELLARLRDQRCRCLITCDKNLRFKQAIVTSGLALVVLPRQRFDDLAPLVDVIVAAIAKAGPGQVVMVSDAKPSTDR